MLPRCLAWSVAVLILVLVPGPRVAHAGMCTGDASDMPRIEAFAKDKHSGVQSGMDGKTWLCVELDATNLRPRIERACRTILDRDGDDSPCVLAAASAGLSKLGDHDIFALIVKRAEEPLETTEPLTRTELLGRLGDPRGAATIVEIWKATIPRADAREHRHQPMADWSTWRQSAAAALGRVGSLDDIAFLQEQSTATKDKFVAQACRDAIAAIQQRASHAN